MATSGGVRSRVRRLAAAALEDFGLRPRRRRAADPALSDGGDDVVDCERASSELPPGVVWHGSARRSAELQCFIDHLEAERVGS